MPGWEAKILAFGSRDYDNYSHIRAKLEEVHLTYYYEEPVTLIHGGASGADELAGKTAVSFGWTVVAEPAKWTQHSSDCWCKPEAKVCKFAGHRRNSKMLSYGPDIGVGFVKGKLSESKGTLDMATKLIEAGIMVVFP